MKLRSRPEMDFWRRISERSESNIEAARALGVSPSNYTRSCCRYQIETPGQRRRRLASQPSNT